jgi:hypothetical protein
MMDRGHLAKVQVQTPDHKTETLPPDQADAAILQAVAVAPALPDAGLHVALEGLRDKDPSLQVREAARTALATRQP